LWLAGWKISNEEVTRERLVARRELRTVTARWRSDILKLVEGVDDIDVRPTDTAYAFEKYRMCSQLLELSAPLSWIHQNAMRKVCRDLFGREVLSMASSIPAASVSRSDATKITVIIMKRAIAMPGGGGLTIYNPEAGQFGWLFSAHDFAVTNGMLRNGVPRRQPQKQP